MVGLDFKGINDSQLKKLYFAINNFQDRIYLRVNFSFLVDNFTFCGGVELAAAAALCGVIPPWWVRDSYKKLGAYADCRL